MLLLYFEKENFAARATRFHVAAVANFLELYS